ncbi:cobalamin-binding protein [Treponema sp. OttesenSCG-928-L16]|nr:cobalamin-binding protein [Treponema sp. OttesenSCG-928-L16]
MKRGRMGPPRTLAGIFLFFTLALQAHPQEVRLQDALDRTLSFKEPPRRIVSLNPAVTEVLFAIGAGDRLVGVTEFCNYPPEALKITKVGGFSGATVSVEQIAVLVPDLVLASAEMHERIVRLLEAVNIRVFTVEPRTIEEVYAVIDRLGHICGQPEGAGEVISGMKEKIRLAQERRRGRETPSVFWEVWDEPLMSAGGSTFISEALSLGGGRNIFSDMKEHWPQVSLEQVILRRPDWIMTVSDRMGAASPENLAKRTGWSSLPALRNGRIAVIESDTIYRWGPRLADAVLEIAHILHP